MQLVTPTNGLTSQQLQEQQETPAENQSAQAGSESQQDQSSNNTTDQTGQPSTSSEEAPAPAESPEITPANALAEYEAHTSGTPYTPPAPGPRPAKRLLNTTRKFEGLEDDEKELFDQMSTKAYEKVYPAYLKSKKLEKEYEQLQSKNKELAEVSFYDQDGAWEIIPEYKQLSQAVSSVNGEQNFWQNKLAEIEQTLANPDPEVVKAARISLLHDYDEKGNPIMKDYPITYNTKAQVLTALNKATVLSNDYTNRLNNLQGSFKDKHSNYIKGLNSVRDELFQGYDMPKISKLSEKKLEKFPTFVRSRPEVQLLAQGWVLIDALVHLLNKNRTANTTTQMRNNISANNGPRGGGGGGGNAGNSAADILNEFKGRGFKP